MPAVHLQTPIPGPNSQALMQRRQTAIPRGPYNSSPVFIAKAEGARLTDVDGNTFIDFAGGIGVMNLGHANARVTAAIAEQAAAFTHGCYHVTPYESYLALAEKLNAMTPGNFAKKTMLANSGAEAVENAIKIARYATGRSGVIAFEHAFHGRTLLGMSLTSKVKPYKYGFGPMATDIYRLPYPYEYRWLHDARPIDWASEYEKIFAEFFASHVAADKIAAVIIEPVLGEGGFVPAPAAALEKIAEICQRHGIVFIADEVQTGFCRTGKFFAIEWTTVAPDIIVMAKSMAAGLPLSALTGRAELMDAPHEGGLGGTYGGNPVACRAALAALAEMERLDLNQRALEIGEITRDYFHRIAVESPFIGEVRGIGAMNAIELVQDKRSRVPYQDGAKRVQKRACQLGLISLTAGTYSNILRTLMPLSINDEHLTEGLMIMEKAILSLADEV